MSRPYIGFLVSHMCCSYMALGALDWRVPSKFHLFQFHTSTEMNDTGCIRFNMEIGVATIAALAVTDDEDDHNEDSMDIIPILSFLPNLMYVCVIWHIKMYLCRK